MPGRAGMDAVAERGRTAAWPARSLRALNINSSRRNGAHNMPQCGGGDKEVAGASDGVLGLLVPRRKRMRVIAHSTRGSMGRSFRTPTLSQGPGRGWEGWDVRRRVHCSVL